MLTTGQRDVFEHTSEGRPGGLEIFLFDDFAEQALLGLAQKPGSRATPPARPAQSFDGASYPIAPDEPIQSCSTYPKRPGNIFDSRAVRTSAAAISE